MVNKVENDYGVWVTSVGCIISMERLKVRRPRLLKDLDEWQYSLAATDLTFNWGLICPYLLREYRDVEEWEYPLICEYLCIEYP